MIFGKYPKVENKNLFLIYVKIRFKERGAAPHSTHNKLKINFAGTGRVCALPQTPPPPGLRPWTPKRVPLTPPTTRLSAQTVGGGSGRTAEPVEEDEDSTVLPATAREYSTKPQSVGLGPGDSLAVIPAKGCQPTPESILGPKGMDPGAGLQPFPEPRAKSLKKQRGR